MGRVKLQIKKLETPVNKQVTYSKRRFGLQKKANELSILCDIDIVLILFSPAGKLSWTVGHKSSLEQVIMKFASLSPQERAKRKLEGLEQLKRVFKKHDHEVNIEEYMKQITSSVNIEELHQQLQMLHKHLFHLQQRLSSYENFNTVEEGEEVESFLKERLLKIRAQKQLLESNEQVVSLSHGFGSQFYQSEALSNSGLLEGNIQSSWLTDHGQQSILANSSFSQRDVDNGAVCSSFPAHMLQLAKQQTECTDDQLKYKIYSQLTNAFRNHVYDHESSELQKQPNSEMELDADTPEFTSSGGTASLASNMEHMGRGPWYRSSKVTANAEFINIQSSGYQFSQQAQI